MDTNNNIPTHKIVNGIQVPLTQEEINSIQESWNNGLIEAQNIASEEAINIEKELLKINLLEQLLNSQ